MPFDTMLFCAAVIAMFLVFGGVLVWGDLQTRSPRAKSVPHSGKR
jgi:hypothetical protein